MGKKNCPRCGKYLQSGAKGFAAHQRDSEFCKSMTAEEHKAHRKAAREAAIRKDDDESDAQWYFREGAKLVREFERENK